MAVRSKAYEALIAARHGKALRAALASAAEPVLASCGRAQWNATAMRTLRAVAPGICPTHTSVRAAPRSWKQGFYRSEFRDW